MSDAPTLVATATAALTKPDILDAFAAFLRPNVAQADASNDIVKQ
jgi:hypothetical protein